MGAGGGVRKMVIFERCIKLTLDGQCVRRPCFVLILLRLNCLDYLRPSDKSVNIVRVLNYMCEGRGGGGGLGRDRARGRER